MRKDIEASKHETKPVLENEACLSFLGRSHCAHGNRVGPNATRRLGIPLISFVFLVGNEVFLGKWAP